MPSSTAAVAPRQGLGATLRRDRWWIEPLWTGLGFLTFVLYSSWAAFQGEHYYAETYLSPFYSPELFGDSPHAWFGPKPVSTPPFPDFL